MGCIIFFTSSTMKVYSNIQFVKSGQKIWAGPSPPLIWTKSKRTATFFGRLPLTESLELEIYWIRSLFLMIFNFQSGLSLQRGVISSRKQFNSNSLTPSTFDDWVTSNFAPTESKGWSPRGCCILEPLGKVTFGPDQLFVTNW